MKYNEFLSFLNNQPFNRSLGPEPLETIVEDMGSGEIEKGDDFNRCGMMMTLINSKKPKNYGEVAKIVEEWGEKIGNAQIIC
jgi:hypothetical protein